MPIELLYDDQADIPEGFADLYEERDGKWHLTGVTGLKTDADLEPLNTQLVGKRKELTRLHEELKGFKPYADLGSVEEIQGKLDRIEELEAAAGDKLDDDKINDIAERRAAAKSAPVERKLTAAEKRAEAAEALVEEYRTKDDRAEIVKKAWAAAKEAGVPEDARPDVEMAASMMMQRDRETGEVLAKEGIGVTPNVGPEVWIMDMLAKRPLWNPASQGSGAGGSSSKSGMGKNPWGADTWNMTEQAAFEQKHGTEKAKQMARAAGTTLGGLRPKKK